MVKISIKMQEGLEELRQRVKKGQVCKEIEVALDKEGEKMVLVIEIGIMVEGLKELWKESNESMNESMRDIH